MSIPAFDTWAGAAWESSLMPTVSGRTFIGRKVPVKTWLMNAKNVVGVGNIYASEALYLAGIRPTIRASRISEISVLSSG